jgi:hypothetical protein
MDGIEIQFSKVVKDEQMAGGAPVAGQLRV